MYLTSYLSSLEFPALIAGLLLRPSAWFDGEVVVVSLVNGDDIDCPQSLQAIGCFWKNARFLRPQCGQASITSFHLTLLLDKLADEDK